MFADAPAAAEKPPRRPFYRRWLFWLAGSLLIAATPVLLQSWLGGSPPEGSHLTKGIHLRAFGIFSASNSVTIEDGAGPPEGEPVLVESRGGTASNVVHVKKR